MNRLARSLALDGGSVSSDLSIASNHMADQSLTADQLAVEISRLEHQASSLSRARERLHDRIDRGFGNDAKLRQEREISDARRELYGRIDALRAQLLQQTNRQRL
jgi:hypothetical protein